MTVLPSRGCGSTASTFIGRPCSRISLRLATMVRALVFRICSVAARSASVAMPISTGKPSVSSGGVLGRPHHPRSHRTLLGRQQHHVADLRPQVARVARSAAARWK